MKKSIEKSAKKKKKPIDKVLFNKYYVQARFESPLTERKGARGS